MIPSSSQQYESVDTFLLLQEFYSIPNNPIDFEVPPGMVITTGMAHTFIQAAYYRMGLPINSH